MSARTTSNSVLAGGAATSQASQSFSGLAILVLVWGLLLGASVVQDALGWGAASRIWLLDVDVERSFYTWFSQLVLALTGLMLADTALKTMSTDRLVASQFAVLSVVFFLLSADEGLSFHEVLSTNMSSIAGLYFAWVIPAAILCMVALIAAFPFLRRISQGVRNRMLFAGAVFVGGALGMEAIGGEVLRAYGNDVLAGPYRLMVNIEEGAEGLGVILFLFALKLHREEAGLTPGITLFR